MITKIIDLTDFVKEQKQIIKNKNIEKLQIPIEQIYKPHNINTIKQIGLEY